LPIFEVLKEIEYYRRLNSFTWGRLITATGAIILKNPTFFACMKGIIWKFCADLVRNI